MRGVVAEMMALGWAMLGTMLVFSTALAAAILFNTTSASPRRTCGSRREIT